MLFRGRNLYRHSIGWERAGRAGARTTRLRTGQLVMLDPDLIEAVLSDTRHFAEESAFFRTKSHDPFNRELRQVLIKSMLHLFGRHRLRPDLAFAAAKAHFRDRETTQAWGPQFMYALFADAIVGDRPEPMRRCLDRLVWDRIIRVDIQGARSAMSADEWRRGLESVGRCIAETEPTPGEPHRNLLEVIAAARLDIPLVETGHLLVRLIQANIAFTGIALEWNLSRAVHDPEYADALDGNLKTHIVRSFIDFPITWRLVRTVATAHTIDDITLSPGEQVVLAVGTGQTLRLADGEAGPDLADFPLLTFGRGPGRCPGQSLAFEAIATSIHHLTCHYSIAIPDLDQSKPYVTSLYTPAKRPIRFRPIDR